MKKKYLTLILLLAAPLSVLASDWEEKSNNLPMNSPITAMSGLGSDFVFIGTLGDGIFRAETSSMD